MVLRTFTHSLFNLLILINISQVPSSPQVSAILSQPLTGYEPAPLGPVEPRRALFKLEPLVKRIDAHLHTLHHAKQQQQRK